MPHYTRSCNQILTSKRHMFVVFPQSLHLGEALFLARLRLQHLLPLGVCRGCVHCVFPSVRSAWSTSTTLHLFQCAGCYSAAPWLFGKHCRNWIQTR